MTPLLALHGFTGSPHSWDFLGDLPRNAPALLGHVDDTSSSEHFVDEVDRLLDFAPSEPCHVVGYSLGARLALSLAVRHPQRVARLTLISGSAGLTTEAERAARRAADARWIELLRTRGLESFVDAWQDLPLWSSQATLSRELRQQKRGERLSHQAEGLARSLRVIGLAEMPSYASALSEIGCPATVVAGALDTKFHALAEQLAKAMPRAKLEVVPNAGHDLLLERPDFITAVIRRGNPT